MIQLLFHVINAMNIGNCIEYVTNISNIVFRISTKTAKYVYRLAYDGTC